MSFHTFTKWSSIQIQPVIKRLSASGLAHKTFNIAVFWLGDLFSSCLHHEAKATEFRGMSFLTSTSCKCEAKLGVELASVQDKTQGINSGVNAGFVVEFVEEVWLVSADLFKSGFGFC